MATSSLITNKGMRKTHMRMIMIGLQQGQPPGYARRPGVDAAGAVRPYLPRHLLRFSQLSRPAPGPSAENRDKVAPIAQVLIVIGHEICGALYLREGPPGFSSSLRVSIRRSDPHPISGPVFMRKAGLFLRAPSGFDCRWSCVGAPRCNRATTPHILPERRPSSRTRMR